MTEKGKMIREKITNILERNIDGVTVMMMKELIDVSRNSIYKYLNELEDEEIITKSFNKWFLSKPIKPKTIPGYQYQAILQGLKEIEPENWNISTKTGRKNFKKLGHYVYEKMKFPQIDVDRLKRKLHKFNEIVELANKMIKEAVTGELDVEIKKLISESGYPDPESRLAALITFTGGYAASEPVVGNGFAHYYILSGIIETFIQKMIISIYGGRCKVNVLSILADKDESAPISKKRDESIQTIDIGVFIYFDKDTPFIDPYTKIESDFVDNFPYDY